MHVNKNTGETPCHTYTGEMLCRLRVHLLADLAFVRMWVTGDRVRLVSFDRLLSAIVEGMATPICARDRQQVVVSQQVMTIFTSVY